MNLTQQTNNWGNSTAIRLPKKVLQAAGWQADQLVELDVKGSVIMLSPVKTNKPTKTPTLGELLKDVTPDKVRGEVDWGSDRGLENIDE